MTQVTIVLVALVTACDLGTITVPKTAPTVVVHGVLNPNSTSQVVLVEQTLTGTITIPDTGFDAADPIVSAGGVPVRGALVEITDPAGKVTRAIEDATVPAANGKGAGVYRFPMPGNSLVLGGRYQLHVHTSAGDDVRASTRIPRATVRSVGGLTRTFNRDHDVLSTSWSGVDLHRTYAVRIESPFGPFFLFTDSTHFRTTGELRNLFSNELERVFIPGFRQEMVVAAVDSNFYDYYRTNNDPFTGSGIISRVTGGLGMFGSIVELNTGTISVVADQTEPIESRFRLLTGDPSTATYASQITLYIESKAARDNLPSALSGRYATPNPNSRTDGVVGELLGSSVTLALLGNQLAGDTLEVFTGQLRGDTLVGSYRTHPGAAVFLRSP
ncbi:MAG: hypothetical protein JWM41_1046 [Gemmatimonadetes bacterium]|nr:hypothetical protein [Gemmatimonadota bacterium]